MTLAAAIAWCALSALAGLLVGIGVRPPQLPPAVRPLPPEGYPTRQVLQAEVETLRRVVRQRDEVIRDLRLASVRERLTVVRG